jgi:hypothetical protein
MRYFAVVSFILFEFANFAVAAPQALYSVDAPNEPVVIQSRNYEKLPPIVDCLVLEDATQRADCLDPALLSREVAKRAIVAPGDTVRNVCNLGLQVAKEHIYFPESKSSANDYVFYDSPGITRLSRFKFTDISLIAEEPHKATLQLKLGPDQSQVPIYVMDFAGSRVNFVWHMAVPVPLSGTLKTAFAVQSNDQSPPYRWFQDVVANTRHPEISHSLGAAQNRKPVSMSKNIPILYDASNTHIFKDIQTYSEIVVVDGIAYLRSVAKFKQKGPSVVLFAFADDGDLDVLCWSKLAQN